MTNAPAYTNITPYDNTPQAKLVATKCACCGRPLKDSTSVEFGIGPICRAKYDYEDAPEVTAKMKAQIATRLSSLPAETQDYFWATVNRGDSREAANFLVKYIAVHQKDDESKKAVQMLRILSFEKLADRIDRRLESDIEIVIEEGWIKVLVGYDEDYIKGVKAIPGRRYEAGKRLWKVPTPQKRALWNVLRDCFAGCSVKGPKGLFVLQPLED